MYEKEEQQFLCRMGDKITKVRKSRKMSQKAVATYLGVTFQQIQKYEKGVNAISLFKLKKLCLLFQIPLDYFLREDQSQQLFLSKSLMRNVVFKCERLDNHLLSIFWHQRKTLK